MVHYKTRSREEFEEMLNKHRQRKSPNDI